MVVIGNKNYDRKNFDLCIAGFYNRKIHFGKEHIGNCWFSEKKEIHNLEFENLFSRINQK